MSVLNKGRAQPWRSANAGTYNSWIRITTTVPAPPVGSTLGTTASYTQDHTLIAGVDSVRVLNWDWPSLPAGPAPFWSPAGPIGNYLPWAISNNNNPLPVELITFDAIKSGDRVLLKWITASETDCESFIVERSLDLEKNITIDQVAGAGNSTQLQNYQTYDEHPVTGVNYYRLLQVDYDGTVNEASSYIPVRFEGDTRFEIMYLQSGDAHTLVFDYDSDLPVNAQLFDMEGRLVGEVAAFPATVGINSMPLPLQSLAPGTYAIRLSNSAKSVSYRFVKGM